MCPILLSVTSVPQSPTECSKPHVSKGHRKPSDRPSTTGYVIFSRLYKGGRHGRHRVLPHGRVIGSRRGYEQVPHWNNLTISRACSCASNPSWVVVAGCSPSLICAKVEGCLGDVR